MSAFSKCTIYNVQFTIKPYLILIAFIFTFYILHFTFYISPAYAQTATSASALPASSSQPQYPASSIQLPTSISPTSPLYTDLLVSNLFHTFSCLSIGQSVIGQPCLTYQLSKNAQGMLQGVPVLSQVDTSGGVLGTTTSLIGMLFTNPPVRTADYLASVGKDLGIAKEAHAQVVGSGAAVLNPILGLWTVSRNISYIIMIIIFVIIGLMVMFRTKINPQTVITAQAALPGLVLGLILITFSYFLAGIVSDTAFIGTNLVGAYFSTVRGDPQPQDLLNELNNPDPQKKENILTIFSRFAGIVDSGSATAAVENIWDKLGDEVTKWLRIIATTLAVQFLLPYGLGSGVGQIIVATVGAVITNLSPTGIVGLVLSLIAMVVLVYAMLKLLLRLITAYLNIIFLTIIAPFQFLAAALPGRQGIATGWVLNMLAHVLAFPAVLAVLYFVAFILGKSSGPLRVAPPVSDGNSFMPVAFAETPAINVVDQATFPLFAGMNLDLIKLLLAFGALVALPAIPDVIARTIGRVTQAGQLLGEEYSKGVAGGRGYYNQFAGAPSGFAERVGRWTDTKGHVMKDVLFDESGRITKYRWEESNNPLLGAQMGTGSRIASSKFGQWVGKQWNNLRGR